MRRRLLSAGLSTIYACVLFARVSEGGGISIDAGLTPAEDRWILRTQFRDMRRKGDLTEGGAEMRRYAFPTVLAYGLRRDVTVMLRQTIRHEERSVAGASSEETGMEDLFFLAKYKAYRRNTREYTLGIAGTMGLEFPTGDDSFTSRTWDVSPGLYISGRRGPWAADFNASYTWNGFAGRGNRGLDPGDELCLDLAFAHQFGIGKRASASVAPVLELSYRNIWPDGLDGEGKRDAGESLLYVSPGIKFSTSSIIVEALLQIPVWQDQEGSQLERGLAMLVGVRFMF